MDRERSSDKAQAAHLRILSEKAEDALEQARAARELADRAYRLFRQCDTPRPIHPRDMPNPVAPIKGR